MDAPRPSGDPAGNRSDYAAAGTPTQLGEISARFRAAWTGAHDAATASPELLPVRLARAVTAVLAVDGAGLSFIHEDLRVQLGADNDVSSFAERLQFTQGEGPCLEAARTHRALVADAAELSTQWPQLARELFAHTAYRAVLSVPLAISAAANGALDLYLIDEARLRTVSLADASIVADAAVAALRIAQAMTATPSKWSDLPEPSWLRGPSAESRRLVWLAQGMIMVKYGTTAPDALALARGYAFGADTTLDEVAAALVDGRLDLTELAP